MLDQNLEDVATQKSSRVNQVSQAKMSVAVIQKPMLSSPFYLHKQSYLLMSRLQGFEFNAHEMMLNSFSGGIIFPIVFVVYDTPTLKISFCQEVRQTPCNSSLHSASTCYFPVILRHIFILFYLYINCFPVMFKMIFR